MIDNYMRLWSRTIKYHGLPHAVKLNAQFRLHVTRFVCGDPLTLSPYRISLTEDGLPRVLGPLIPIIREKNPDDLRVVLTILSVGRIELGDGTLDVSSIVQPSNIDLVKYPLLEQGISALVGKLQRKGFLPEQLITEWSEPHFTTKMGPKGQALATALDDLSGLPEELKKDLITLGGVNLQNYMDLLMPAAKGLHPDTVNPLRRISVIRDKERKNRPIAIFDYWSQTALYTLHASLFDLFRRIPTDLTHNQDGVRSLLSIPTISYYSIDLSAATDRFPVCLQETVLQMLIGKEKAGAWKRIMTRELKIPKGGTISYEVGQPMGAYSSWAVFTLCHHLVVQYSAQQAGFPTWYDRYRVLGDDIVILDESVAIRYKENIAILGVSISNTKSHVSSDTFEMAKRWFIKGTEFSPYPLVGLLENRSNPHGLSQEIYNSFRKGWATNLTNGVPSGNHLTQLLKIFGWGRRSRDLRTIDIERWIHLSFVVHDPDGLDRNLSIRFLASSFGQSSCVASATSWASQLLEILEHVKVRELTDGMASSKNKLAGSLTKAVDLMFSLDKVCLPPCNPYAIALAFPHIRLMGLASQQLERELAKLVGLAPSTLKEVLSLGAGVRFPDPDRINSKRTSQVIMARTGALLHKVFRSYEEIIRS
ncbi:MAG: RNA-dependent RNA polymerase [Hangzhou mitovirus 7]|nr:MAG: RNA-dependent RNA polymerase [Hangzhou mitovirus 7]